MTEQSQVNLDLDGDGIITQSEIQLADHAALSACETDLHRWLNSARTAINMGEPLPPMPVYTQPSLSLTAE